MYHRHNPTDLVFIFSRQQNLLGLLKYYGNRMLTRKQVTEMYIAKYKFRIYSYIKIMVFCVLALRSLVGAYGRFGGTFCLQRQISNGPKDGGKSVSER
jgi:hypothetical protein